MASTIDLRSISALGELGQQIDSVRTRMFRDTDDIFAQLRSLEGRLEAIGQERADEVRQAERALAEVDEGESDYTEREQLQAALEAQRRYENARQAFGAAKTRLEIATRQLNERCGDCSRSAVGELGAKVDAAEKYRAIQMPAVVATSGSSTASSRKSSASQGANPHKTGDTEGLPDGMSWVNLADLSEDCFVDDPAEFKKVDYGTMLEGARLLRDNLLPAVAANPAITLDDIQALDASNPAIASEPGQFHPNSLSNLWAVFLDKNGSDLVAIDRSSDGRLSLNSGRHRLGLARKLGMTSFPCRLLEGRA